MKTIVTTFLLSFLSCCAFAQDKRAISAAEAGCGPQDAKFEVKTDESQHPTATPEDGKALIYVVAYFFVPIDPGEHHVCAMLQSFHPDRSRPRVSVHSLKAEPGGVYYFRTRLVGISTGFVLQLDQLDSDEGSWFVAWSKFSTSHPKD
jgi:hypothetical protein